jgi:hypothetical protein
MLKGLERRLALGGYDTYSAENRRLHVLALENRDRFKTLIARAKELGRWTRAGTPQTGLASLRPVGSQSQLAAALLGRGVARAGCKEVD